MDILSQRGAQVDYHDPHVPVIPATREHSQYEGIRSVDLTPDGLAGYHA